MKKEPVVTIGAVTAVIVAGLSLATAFGLNLTDAQQAAILGVVGAVAPVVAAFVTRRKVSPVAAIPAVQPEAPNPPAPAPAPAPEATTPEAPAPEAPNA